MDEGLRKRSTVKSKYPDTNSESKNYSSDEGERATRRMWLIFAIVLVIVIFGPVVIVLLIPAPISARPVASGELPRLEGSLTPNEELGRAKRMYSNQLIGPESIVAHAGDLFTGTADGKILRLRNGTIEVLTRLGTDQCGLNKDEAICGRPLGLRINEEGDLIAVDGYFGLFQIDVTDGKSKVLWPNTAAINGRRAKLFNDVAVAKDGKIYFTDSSTKWSRRDFVMIILEGETSGRLIEYDMRSNTTRELMTGLSFANGVQLSPDGDFILVVETVNRRIWKYHLAGKDRGTYKIFADNLPGFADNVRASRSGGYWVAFASVMHREKFSLAAFVGDKPWLRNIMSKLGNKLVSFAAATKYGLIVELNQRGEIVRSLHDPTGQIIPSVSEVEDIGSTLYLGSYLLPYLSELEV